MNYIIFDMDGTLLDSMSVWEQVDRNYIEKYGLDVPPEKLHEMFKVMTLPDSADYLHKNYQPKIPPEQICRETEEMGRREYEYNVPLKDGVREALEQFQQAGIRMCVASASERVHVETALRRLGVLDLFAFVRTCTEAGSGKEQPEIFRQCAQLLGAQDCGEVIVFDDASHALKTAKDAGFRTAAVYDSAFAQDEKYLRGLCDYYFSSAWEWPQILR